MIYYVKSLCAGSPELGAGSIESLQLIKKKRRRVEKYIKKCAEGRGFSKHSAASEKCCWLLVSAS